ncbi:MAG: biopolymer transporter ExbD [bacterium]|nr:biopolymer transporter ExbD [bacterium]MDD6832589.1 biopolymer transporter ExbD [bacterium]MDD6900900.1 biopolymer transporter ExbD [bacterium]MDY4185342.1 biopolymer transporter ExbD [Sodaliphilus sp.]
MGKVKVKKQDPRIDMTAMSDVTVLLLTFFMLTSTFLQEEPVKVITPASVSEDVVPEQKLITVLVSQNEHDGHGQVYMEIVGASKKDDADSAFTTENVKKQVLQIMAQKHNIQFSAQNYADFAKLNAFGHPIKDLKAWLDLPVNERAEALKKSPGIPINMTTYGGDLTEFQEWIRACAEVFSQREDATEDIRSGKAIAIKADANTPYRMVEIVMNNLQSIKRNKFTLMTSLKTAKD